MSLILKVVGIDVLDFINNINEKLSMSEVTIFKTQVKHVSSKTKVFST